MSTPSPPSPLPTSPVGTIPEAIDRMEAIAAAVPETDGVACFNRMYLAVTRAVGEQIGAGFYGDAAFMERLDVVFVNLYLGALRQWAIDRSGVCRSWAVLISRCQQTDIAPLQFAVAGMNAHINHDLPLALVATCKETGTRLDDGSHHEDFAKVNLLLARLSPAIRQAFEIGVIAELDRRFGGLDDLVANFSISAGREVAWDNATTLSHLGGNRFLTRPFMDSLDRFTAFAGRMLLAPLH